SQVRADVLDAWFPPAPRVLSVLSRHLATICNTSPEVEPVSLRRAIASWRGLPEDSVLVGPGASSLIHSCLPKFVADCRHAAVLDPTYSEYPYLLEERLGMRLCRIPEQLPDTEDLSGADALVVVNPNNPTGRVIDAQAIVAGLSSRQRLWVDETYLEYTSAPSVEQVAAAQRNVVVCKSLSKTLALSGLRIGYLVGHPETLRTLAPEQHPWPISLPAQVATMAAIEDPTYYRNRYADTRSARKDLAESLRAIQTEINCVLLPRPDATEFARRLAQENIFVRDLGNGMLRIAVRPRPESWKMIQTIHRLDPSTMDP
ncbi:MAG TPA: aminotransferase class I/II-fold pyridoxal phosphate-dependent enzyme, partial [Fimbriimonas sp.]